MIKSILESHCIWLIALWLILCLFIIPVVSAEDFTAYSETVHIANGGCVPLNSTADISSFGWGVPYISYYGPYENSFDPGNTTPKNRISLPSSAHALQKYYIDPAIFDDKPGFWYQDYDQSHEPGAANYRMFYVADTCRVPIIGNGTELINITKINTTYPKPLSYLPEKPVGALLLARGDSYYFTAPSAEESNVWVFGRDKDFSIYDQPTNQITIAFEADQFINFEPGNYDAVIIQKGKNEILEEGYDPAYKPDKYSTLTWPAIVSPFRNVSAVNIHGIQPRLVEELLKKQVAQSIDDELTIWPISFQDPEIQIKRIDAIKSINNKSWYNLRGYTNVKNGTTLIITIDADKLNGETVDTRQWKTKAEGLDPDAWRQFNALVPVDYDNIFPGYHYITITSETGATQTVPVYIMKELDPHYIPPEYTEYLGTSPFVTPQIVVKEVPGPVQTQIVIVHDTPKPEDVQAAADRSLWNAIYLIVEWMAFLIGIILIGAWVYSSYRRAKA